MNCSQAIIGEEILCISAAKTSREILNAALIEEIEQRVNKDRTEVRHLLKFFHAYFCIYNSG